jgi:dihydroorotate dehydrogenase (fumarate)
MIDLACNYMGLKLRNPLLVGSSGLTNAVENIVEIERNGAGAVVLKSLFEEQIHNAGDQATSRGTALYQESEDYIRNFSRPDDLKEYFDLISKAKQTVAIPIIASINCITDSGWVSSAKQIEEAGADALELNISVSPSDSEKGVAENEKIHFQIIEKILKEVTIPVAVKVSYYFTNLAKTVQELSQTGIKSMVLFNRFYSPDFDIEREEVKTTFVFSTPSDIAISLRWIAMLSPLVKCDLCASTGVHDGTGLVKQLLAGASAVQVASVLYKKGFMEIATLIDYLENWMDRHGYTLIEDFKGKLAGSKLVNPAPNERVQFMKHFSGIE